ncbi:MAG: energy-coupling factor transporter ATPase [Armatimonadota bacterium]|nr:energy-coupling factor transporter ATPase [Armatimonadota bacterium]MDR7518783.1 energy-coupling factor transporter ATPase [Armatimonadota bacterium]MDR7549628.1 energy-coupling factor transporter ATPase [Armatimonadota bacterium]
MAEPLIDCQDVAHTYLRGTPMAQDALRGVTLQIRAGDLVGIIGPTGSGKSTLIQHFNGLLRPTRGTVRIAGEDLWAPQTDRRRVRQRIGLVFQFPEYQLFEETVRADVAYGPRNLGLPEDEVSARVDDALRAVGLDPGAFGPRSPFSLSGGEMRRVALAGILAMRPEVLVLDEPAAGLDPRGKADLLDRIERLHRSGLTVILVTHSMDEVARLARRIVVMHGGRVVAEGSPREIFAREEEVRRIGLRLPQAAELVRRLRQRGLAVPDALTIAEARVAIRAAIREGSRGTV